LIVTLTSSTAEITGNPKAAMSWKKYHNDIVMTHHVGLKNWPFPGEFDIHTLGPKKLEELIRLLTPCDGESEAVCRWEKLSEAEVDELEARYREEIQAKPPKPRKTRSDKGTTRKASPNRDGGEVSD